MRTTLARRGAPALLALQALAACTLPLRTREEEPGNVVLVADPAPAPGPALPAATIEEPTPGRDLMNLATRLVANDGRVRHEMLVGQDWWQAVACGRTVFSPAPDPLAASGSVLAGAPARVAHSSWVFVGLEIGSDGPVSLFGGPCVGRRMPASAGDRLARLAPGLSARDTNLTFTTARAAIARPEGGTSFVEAVLREAVRHAVGGDDEPRTAQPRPAPAPAPAKTAETTRRDEGRESKPTDPAPGRAVRTGGRGQR